MAKTMKSKSRKYTKKVVSAKKVEKVVNEVMKKNVEVKKTTYGATSTQISNNAPVTAPVSAYTFDLSQGATDDQRIGNRVRVKKFLVHGHINMIPAGEAPNNVRKPCLVRLALLKVKQQLTPPTAGQLSQVLNNGNTDQALTYEYPSSYLEWNKDLFEIVKSKTFKLGYSANPDGLASGTGSSNNDFSLMRRFKFRVDKMKNLIYQGGLTPATNHALFLVANYVNYDESQDAATNAPINIYEQAELHYTDE